MFITDGRSLGASTPINVIELFPIKEENNFETVEILFLNDENIEAVVSTKVGFYYVNSKIKMKNFSRTYGHLSAKIK